MSGNELFYIDENGKKRDVKVHDKILEEGDNDAAMDVGRKNAESIGLSKATIESIYGKQK